jgi:hypothetical protein
MCDSAGFCRSPWCAISFPQYGYAEQTSPNPSLFPDMGEKCFFKIACKTRASPSRGESCEFSLARNDCGYLRASRPQLFCSYALAPWHVLEPIDITMLFVPQVIVRARAVAQT